MLLTQVQVIIRYNNIPSYYLYNTCNWSFRQLGGGGWLLLPHFFSQQTFFFKFTYIKSYFCITKLLGRVKNIQKNFVFKYTSPYLLNTIMSYFLWQFQNFYMKMYHDEKKASNKINFKKFKQESKPQFNQFITIYCQVLNQTR